MLAPAPKVSAVLHLDILAHVLYGMQVPTRCIQP